MRRFKCAKFTKFKIHTRFQIHTSKNWFASYKCDECNQRFSDSNFLDEHKKSHSLAFNCEVCHKSFSSKNNLNSHMIIHKALGEKVKIVENVKKVEPDSNQEEWSGIKLEIIEPGKVNNIYNNP